MRSNSLVFPHISLSNMASMETPNTVFVQITSSVTSFTSEKRLQRNETISLLKVCSNRKLLIFSEQKLSLNSNKIALYVTLLGIVVTSVVFVDVCLYTKRFRSWKQIMNNLSWYIKSAQISNWFYFRQSMEVFRYAIINNFLKMMW